MTIAQLKGELFEVSKNFISPHLKYGVQHCRIFFYSSIDRYDSCLFYEKPDYFMITG